MWSSTITPSTKGSMFFFIILNASSKEDFEFVLESVNQWDTLCTYHYPIKATTTIISTSNIFIMVGYVYAIWMWIDWYRKYQQAVPEYEVWWRVGEANESLSSYSVEQADIFQYQTYSHSDDRFIILKLNISTNTSIFVFLREKSHDSKYSKYASLKHSS